MATDQRQHQPDHRRVARHHGHHRFRRRLRLVGRILLHLPAKIDLRHLANGTTSGTVTQGVQQNLTTTVIDTNGNPITGLTLDYQSTNPIDITAGVTGGVTASFPGAASVYAICQPAICNPAPINQVGLNGTGLSISSNPVNITTPGTASAYVWFAAPGKSQYFVPVELLTGTLGSTVRLPYVPNSMVMDQTGTNLYFGSSHELMVYSTTTNTLSRSRTPMPRAWCWPFRPTTRS